MLALPSLMSANASAPAAYAAYAAYAAKGGRGVLAHQAGCAYAVAQRTQPQHTLPWRTPIL